jgi:cytochrome c553
MFIFISCENNLPQSKNHTSSVTNSFPIEDLKLGFQQLNSLCFSCHSPQQNQKNKIAPDITEIKKAYLTQSSSFETFHTLIYTFVNEPTSKYKLITGQHSYGAMPKFDLSDKEISQISMYLYQTLIEDPDWYSRHYDLEVKKYKPNYNSLSYIEKGKKLALSTKSVLGKNLKGAIKKKGTSEAISFCNTKAIALTDSMSIRLNAKIKRVSDQPRNPNNLANENELKYILDKKEAIQNSQPISPQLQKVENKMIGYYPIITNKMCLQCHGNPTQNIQPDVIQKLNALYPADLAIGYGENEIRGIWVVEMDIIKN